MTSLKPSSITWFFCCQTIDDCQENKPEVIEIDADEIPERIMIATTEKDGRVVNVEVGVAKKIWPNEYLAVRSFAGGEWVHAAMMAGWQASQAANGPYRKTQKNNTAHRLCLDQIYRWTTKNLKSDMLSQS